MRLPPEIPDELATLAVGLPDLVDGEGAWTRGDALAVVESLRGTTVAVSDVILYEPAPWGYAATETEWHVDRAPNEPDTEYSLRTRSGASEFIRSCESAFERALFVLTFPWMKDAA